MLFRTVYGAELDAIYFYLQKHTSDGEWITVAQLNSVFVNRIPPQKLVNHHIDDAISFLKSAYLIEEDQGNLRTLKPVDNFRIAILRNLRRLEMGEIDALHPLDPFFLGILTEVFIKPDQLFVRSMHTEVNSLRSIQALGGISREKVQAWKRVMAFLGIGYRAFNGFMCVYDESLIRLLTMRWESESGTLQTFIEKHLEQYLPCTNQAGDLAKPVSLSLQQLQTRGLIILHHLQDSPSKSYLGQEQLKGIRKQMTYV